MNKKKDHQLMVFFVSNLEYASHCGLLLLQENKNNVSTIININLIF